MMKIYEQERAHGTLVSLDGHGADELFCGYNFDALKALPDAHFNKKDIDNIMRAYLDQLADSEHDVHSREFKRKRNRIYANEIVRYYGKKLLGRKPVDSAYADHPAWRDMDNLNKALFVSTHETVLPTLLRNYDRDSMAASVEIRMPFMDYRLVQLAFSIGWGSKLHDGYTKSVIRDACAPFMPGDIAYRRTKVGFNAPINNWMKTSYREMFADILASKGFKECSLIEDADGVRRDFQRVLEDDGVSFSFACYNVWNKLQLYLWEQAFIKGKGISR
jgi:asparagine synthase (glutamine-hydrolysing)